jgi:hypothetical protein
LKEKHDQEIRMKMSEVDLAQKERVTVQENELKKIQTELAIFKDAENLSL